MTAALRLPLSLIQPFFLRYRRDDLHVMAVFTGHPVYEAVEAMITRRDDATFATRAILTRHDQSQIDHIDSAAMFEEMAGAAREVVTRAIDVTIEERTGGPRVTVAFASADHERVVLDITAVSQPSKTGAGLSNPGGHSKSASLPLMWRGASTLAAAETTVTIDERRFVIPVKVQRDAFTALEGYVTLSHSMGVFRAGSQTTRILSGPTALKPGAEWRYAGSCYRIAATDREGNLHIERTDGVGESLIAHRGNEGLEIRELRLHDRGTPGNDLVLSFGAFRDFVVTIEGQRVLSGTFECECAEDSGRIRLVPREPDWARERPVTMLYWRDTDGWRVTTTIGDAKRREASP